MVVLVLRLREVLAGEVPVALEGGPVEDRMREMGGMLERFWDCDCEVLVKRSFFWACEAFPDTTWDWDSNFKLSIWDSPVESSGGCWD